MNKERKWMTLSWMMVPFVSIIFLFPAWGQADSPDKIFNDRTIDLGRFDPCFIENKGQWDLSILFSAETDYGHISLTKTGILIDLMHSANEEGFVDSYRVEITFSNSNAVSLVGDDQVITEYNYFLGNDPTNWIAGVKGYETVHYCGLWDGIDLIYRFTDTGLKYDLIVLPGADPSDIGFSVGEIDVANIDPHTIAIRTPLGSLIDSGLSAFEEDGSPVIASFSADGPSWGFCIGAYDRSQTLTIDPNIDVVDFSTYIGGWGNECMGDMGMDDDGNIYVCGWTSSSDFPTSDDAFQLYHKNVSEGNNYDGYVFRIDPEGKYLLNSTYFGGNGMDYPTSLKWWGKHLYLMGCTDSVDFPTSKNAYQRMIASHKTDLFVAQFDPFLKYLVFSTYVGGSGYDFADPMSSTTIDIDPEGNIYSSGATDSDDFPLTIDAFQDSITKGSTSIPSEDLVIFKLSKDGSSLLYSTYLGGSGGEAVQSMIYHDRALYLGGYTMSVDFNVSSRAYSRQFHGSVDGFITVFDVSEFAISYSTYIGGKDEDCIRDIAVAKNKTIYACGMTRSSDFPVSENALDPIRAGQDGFVLNLNVSNDKLSFSSYFGGSFTDELSSIAIDGGSNIHLVGTTDSENFSVSKGGFQENLKKTSAGQAYPEAAYVKLSGNGSCILYSTFIGGSMPERGIDVLVDERTGHPIIGGETESYDFPSTKKVYQNFNKGQCDDFLIKIDTRLPPLPPSDPKAYPGDEFVNITWKEPFPDRGDPVIDYVVYKGTASTLYDEEFHVGLDLYYNDTNVINGKFYYYALQAVSRIGPSGLSSEIVSRPASAPSPPEDFAVDYTLGRMNITWGPPHDNGGLNLLGYFLYKAISGSDFTPIAIDSDIWSYSDPEVEIGKSYDYYMIVQNIIGRSLPTSVATEIARCRPSPPQYVAAITGSRFVNLTWDPPEFDGGAPIVGYAVYRSYEDHVPDRFLEFGPDRLYYNDTEVINGKKYEYFVTSFNDEEESERTEGIIAIPLSRPTQPLDVAATASEGMVTISWDPPADTGGTNITSYSIFRLNVFSEWERLGTVPGQDEEYADLSVVNGRSYIYQITAKNAKGESDPSMRVSATPMGRPSIPLNLQAISGDSFALIAWKLPANSGGSPILSYWIFRGAEGGGLEFLTNTTSLEFNDTTVVNGLQYGYSVSAMNVKGFSDLSQVVLAEPRGAPKPPVDVTLTPGDGWIFISWSPPLSDGGSEILEVVIRRSEPNGEIFTRTSADPRGSINDTGLQNGVTYTYTLTASNKFGSSPSSQSISAIPSGLPGAPRSLKIVEIDMSLKLTWLPPLKDGGRPITGYSVYRTVDGTEMKLGLLGPTSYSYIDHEIVSGVRYVYTVTALNTNGESPRSIDSGFAIAKGEKESNPLVIAIVVVVLLLMIAIALNWYLMKKMKIAREKSAPSQNIISPTSMENEYYDPAGEPIQISDEGSPEGDDGDRLPPRVPNVDWSEEQTFLDQSRDV